MIEILSNCMSWDDYRFIVKQLSENQKGDCFEVLTKGLLKVHSTYTTQLKDVWRLQEVPSDVRSFLNLPATDEGIDLIAETRDDEFWAIQCKYREDETTSLSRHDLSTFTDLAFNICRNISFGLICTNADRFSHKLTLYGNRLGICAGDLWRSLDNEFFERLHEYLKGKCPSPTPRAPFPHQQAAIENAHRHFIEETNSRGKMIMPCGTGKSLSAYWIAERLGARKILVAVPSLALIRQTFQVWARENVARGHEVRWIAVCSDESVGNIEQDEIAVMTQDLGIHIQTDPDEIALWFKKQSGNTIVAFVTYQSGPAIAKAAKKAEVAFDLGILDEAHKTVGKKGRLFTHLLYDENIAIKKRVFMTATERRYVGTGDEIASMDDLDLYGETFELLTFKRALEAEPPILSDYRILTLLITEKEIEQLIDQNSFVKPDKGKWDKEIEAQMLASIIALRKAIQVHPIKHAVSFHRSIARARAFKESHDNFSQAFPQYGDLRTYHVSGGMPTAERSRRIDEFVRAERSLITNARCLTEGVDVPAIDCVLFADPKGSTVDVVQGVGRALRRAEGKQFGYVIIPVRIDPESPDALLLQQSEFDKVLRILRALAANDERIVDYFRTVSQGRKWKESRRPFEIDLPEGIGIDLDSFVNSVESVCWSRLAKLSWRPFEEARNFVQSLGLKNNKEWRLFCIGRLPEKGLLPKDIPTNPEKTYSTEGWTSYGDWLGTGSLSTSMHEYRSFEEAHRYVHSLALGDYKEWRMFCIGKLPEKGVLPKDIPTNPGRTYKDQGWTSWGDWLGTGSVAPQTREFAPFEEARKYVRSLRIKNQEQWRLFCKGLLPDKGSLPRDIPGAPNQVFMGRGWKGYGDWLGTGNVAPQMREFMTFEDARHYVRGLGLKSKKEWDLFCKGLMPDKGLIPKDVPTNPHVVYKCQRWISYGDWLGTGSVAPQMRDFKPFSEARQYVRELGLGGQKQWRIYCKGLLPEIGTLPRDIPAVPERVYRGKGWNGYGDWLGTGFIAPAMRTFRSFSEARSFARSLRLKGYERWRLFCEGKMPEKGLLPNDIPSKPERTYKDHGWVSYGDWLGTGSIATTLRCFRPFEEAREFVHNLELTSRREWGIFCKGLMPAKGSLPKDIPTTPSRTYKDQGWISYGDWLGTSSIAPQRRSYRSFDTARVFAHNLQLKSYEDWRQYCTGAFSEKPQLPQDIPRRPDQKYKESGWQGWEDWLGSQNRRPKS